MELQKNSVIIVGSASHLSLSTFPVELKRRFFSGIDRQFLVILLCAGSIVSLLLGFFSARPIPHVVSDTEIQKIQKRYATLVLNKPEPKGIELPKKEIVHKPEKNIEQKEVKQPIIVPSSPSEASTESVVSKKERKDATYEMRQKQRQAITKQIESSGIFAAITSHGGGSKTKGVSRATDLLGTGDILSGVSSLSLSKASFDIPITEPKPLVQSRGEKTTHTSITKTQIEPVQQNVVASSGAISVSVQSESVNLTGQGAGTGVRSQATINEIISKEQDRLRKVYESMLKRDPNLAGKIVVRFFVMDDGSVSDVSIVSSTTNNQTFDQRILSYIKLWKFPAMEGSGAVEVIFPIVFTGNK